MNKQKNIKRGEIYLVNLGKRLGSEQDGIRPALIIQNDIGNKYSPTTIVATMTSKNSKKNLPTHYYLNKEDCGIEKDSTVLLEQILTIDKCRLIKKVGQVTQSALDGLDETARISLGVA